MFDFRQQKSVKILRRDHRKPPDDVVFGKGERQPRPCFSIPFYLKGVDFAVRVSIADVTSAITL